MISSRTVYLRKKNEELLTVLKEDAARLNRKLLDFKGLLRKKPEHYHKDEFSEPRRSFSPEIMSPIAPSSSRSGGVDLSQPMKARRRPGRCASPIRIRSSSVDGRHASRSRHSACVPSRPVSTSSSEVRWSKLQQELACHAHMHGYTRSHSLSKCYCTRKQVSASCDNFSGSVKFSLDSTSNKVKIPPRLKEKRYQASPPKHRPCSVKWALPSKTDDACRINLPLDDSEQEITSEPKSSRSLSFSSGGQGDGPGTRPRRGSPVNRVQDKPFQMKPCTFVDAEVTSECESDWFAKMKSFRKSNWDDCHAPEDGLNDGTDCKCTRRFILGERMFLEPVRQSAVDKMCCRSAKSRENVSPPPARETVVTLPRVPLDDRNRDHSKSQEERVYVPSHRPEDRALRTYNINRPCFLTGHKTESDENARARALFQRRPADSFALRYQKGVDPRVP